MHPLPDAVPGAHTHGTSAGSGMRAPCRQAPRLPVRVQAEDEYMISDVDLFVTKYISVPKEFGQLNCAAFVAGIIRGALEGAGFTAR